MIDYLQNGTVQQMLTNKCCIILVYFNSPPLNYRDEYDVMLYPYWYQHQAFTKSCSELF